MRPWRSVEQNAQSPTPTSTTPSSRFYVPSVTLPASAAKAGPVHKIHILGDDERSRFIAHALSGVYASVEMVGMQFPRSRYRNVEMAKREKSRTIRAERNAALANEPSRRKKVKEENSHIDELIVTGRGFEAVQAIESVKHRVDENTSICLMNDGMGVLEDVREQFFKDTKSEPRFMLGHMSHSLVYNRNHDAVKQLKAGRTMITELPSLDEALEKESVLGMSHNRTIAFEHLLESTALRASAGPYDQWVRFKLPSMIFTAVAEPVCVLLDVSYRGLLNNKAAKGMFSKLLDEIIQVVDNLPEVAGSSELQAYLRGSAIQKLCFQKLLGKAQAPSDLLTMVNKGLETDINYQNGYFIRRAKALGIDVPMNTMMMQMVKAKQEEAQAKRDTFISVEECPGPAGWQRRMR